MFATKVNNTSDLFSKKCLRFVKKRQFYERENQQQYVETY